MTSESPRPAAPVTPRTTPQHGPRTAARPNGRPHLYLVYSRDDDAPGTRRPAPAPAPAADRKTSLVAFAALVCAAAGLAAVLLTL
ncbi:hypothetical protein [Salinarimonas soli]|uniref:Uncharacterized protein n=1 Tax=Salinarimonas soli TaxID=1638099 RepID=A0A5B2VPZ2_9HYPH|nr:hypothetical protein [Salinarimonas soli]KAA2241201.1 hypothetical protein F0L46_04185 [Salinarimonas soli]